MASRRDVERVSRRAKLLARMLAETGISVAFRSHFVRAAKTLHPLEGKLSGFLRVKQITYEAAEQPDEYATKVAAAVHALPASAGVAGVRHSATVGPAICRLRGAIRAHGA